MELDELDPVTQLNIKSQLADARLGVAETLGWPLSGFASLATHLAFGSWLVTLGVLLGMYYLATIKYRKESSVLEDRYYQAAGLGKYHKAAEGEADA